MAVAPIMSSVSIVASVDSETFNVVSASQPLNGSLPIVVTLEGMAKDSIYVFWNAPSPIVVSLQPSAKEI